jgi:hypothetical protein
MVCVRGTFGGLSDLFHELVVVCRLGHGRLAPQSDQFHGLMAAVGLELSSTCRLL